MSRRNVWIEISREWIEFAVVSRGRVRTVHRVLIEPSSSVRSHRESSALPPHLRHHITHGLSLMGVSKAWVHVIWHADGSCVDMHTVVSPPPDAAGAALLAFCTANALDQSVWATSAHRLTGSVNSKEKAEQQVLVSALRNDVLVEIEEVVRECGCVLRSVIPAQSIALVMAARGAIESSVHSDGPLVCIHVGEEAASIAIAKRGNLLLARSVEMGFAALREAYLRAAHQRASSHAEAFLAAQKRLLETEGIPSPKDGPDAVAIFQTLRPFVQRLFIEIKQTVRFTLEEEEIPSAGVRLMGPGGTIPRLAPMLGEEAGFASVESVPSPHTSIGAGTGIRDALGVRAMDLAVQPHGRREGRERSRRRAAVLYGAMAATLLLAGDTYLALHRATTGAARVRALQTELDERRTAVQTGRGASPRALAGALETLIRSDSGLRADWGAVLAEVVAARPYGVWFTGVTGERSRDGSSLKIDAIIETMKPGMDPHDLVSRFVEALQSSPLTRDTRLGATEQLERAGRRQTRFSLTIAVHEIQAPWLSAEVTP